MRRYLSMLLICMMLFSTVSVTYAANARSTESADILYELGLFDGVGKTESGKPVYDLDRAPTRHEAIKMLVTLLGKADEACSRQWDMPFKDVAKWAKPYVGYAYANGLTNGTSATTFGGKSLVSASQYLTFVLNALGYNSGTDFKWNSAWTLSDAIGITDGRYNANTRNFLRSDVVMISEAALSAKEKNSEGTLADKLISSGVFTKKQYEEACVRTDVQSPGTGIMDAQMIAKKCSPAVFYIETYALNGELSGSGSGFFISADGLAVTNYHVAENTSAIKIMTNDRRVYSDVTIIDGDRDSDLALLKVNKGGGTFPYLKTESSGSISQGQPVFAIGSPIGLDNTISQGIISNTSRWIDGKKYIQVSVPFTHGSSGGPLINQNGKVIGITSAGYGEADLNLAVPAENIAGLDKNSNNDYVLFGDECYPGFDEAYDFGAFSGVQLMKYNDIPLGFALKYDIWDFHDIGDMSSSDNYANTCYMYKEALLSNGFTHVWEKDGLFGLFESENEELYFESDFDDEGIFIVVEHKPVMYPMAPALTDLGWYLGLGGRYAYIDGSYVYSHTWLGEYSYQDLMDGLDWYFALLEDDGFVCSGTSSDAWIFEGNGLSVVIILDERDIYVDIQYI